jgi:hypothetical protein
MADVVTGLRDEDMETVGLTPKGSDTPLGTDADESDADADEADAADGDADEADATDGDTADTTDGDTTDTADGDTAD